MERFDDLGGVRPVASPPASPMQGAKEQVRHLAQDAKRETSRVASQAGDYVSGLVTQQKDQAAARLGGVAGTLRDLGTRLEDEDGGGGGFGHYAVRAADQVDRLSHYLRDRDLTTFLRDTENFARRRPDVFLGGTFLAGLLLARFLKSSADRGYDGYEAEDFGGVEHPQASPMYSGERFSQTTDLGGPPEPHRTYPGGI